MKLVTKKVSELKLYTYNSKAITSYNYDLLKKYLQKYPLLKPLKVDGRDGITVLGGNQRLKALIDLGVEKVTVNIIDIKNDEHAFEVAIRDNAEFGEIISSKYNELIEEYEPEGFQKMDINFSKINLSDFVLINDVGNIGDINGYEGNDNINVVEIDEKLNEDMYVITLKFSTRKFYDYFLNFLAKLPKNDKLIGENILEYFNKLLNE